MTKVRNRFEKILFGIYMGWRNVPPYSPLHALIVKIKDVGEFYANPENFYSFISDNGIREGDRLKFNISLPCCGDKIGQLWRVGVEGLTHDC